MTKIVNGCIRFFQKETVFCIASLVAVVSMFFVTPSLGYLDYIDFHVLALLLALMLVVAGFQSVGVFDKILPVLIQKSGNTRRLSAILIYVCFFTGMWITNDVALITFVPIAIMVLKKIDRFDLLIPVIVLQTIAANLGSMCTPIGNPQNLYLYTISGIGIGEFLQIMLPLTVASFVLLALSLLWIKKESVANISFQGSIEIEDSKMEGFKTLCYGVLFVLCILTVLHIVDYRITLIVVVLSVLLLRPVLLLKADYMLLLTFISFFVFVGNMKNIPFIHSFFSHWVSGREIMVSILSSQVISNVPAAVLLSGFTDNVSGLLIGTNLGGLGTLIASMASLISYKFYAKEKHASTGKYILWFTVVNVLFLVVLSIFTFIVESVW